MWNENQPLDDIHFELAKHIQYIRELVTQIEGASGFGRLFQPDYNRDGVLNFSYWDQSEIVLSFVNLAHRIPLMVQYDWVSWVEGISILQSEYFEMHTLDLLQKCKLITMMIRADRFNEGFLIHQFENGNVLRLLRALVDEKDSFR